METEKHQPRWPAAEPILPPETAPLPAALRQAALLSEPERPTRWVLILIGIAVLFGSVVAGGYSLLKRGQTPVAAQAIPARNPTAKPAPVAADGPAIPPAPQLVVGLRPLTNQRPPDQPAMAPAAQSPAPAADQPSKLASGLPPITAQVPLNVLAPAAVGAPPSAEPRPPAPLLPLRPTRKIAAPPSASPGAPPSRSSGTVKF
jgi:hypothetical protein